MSLKYICAQPDELYYAWQIEVMLDNFLSVGIEASDIHIVVGIQKHIGEWWHKLIFKYPEVGFFFYNICIYRSKYPPAIRPAALSEHWKRFPNLRQETIFYHDCDILFTNSPNFDKLTRDDIWYMSNTISYIGSEYIRSKGEDVYLGMCKQIDMDPFIPINNEQNSGGSQYILKDVSYFFWYMVYDYSSRFYEYLLSTKTDIQSWTADMWALLWTAWVCGYKTKIDPYLNFSMATDTWPKWDKNLIYHNAGAVPEHEGILFRKDQFRDKLPYMDHNPYNDDFCSYYYFDQVVKTGHSSCLTLRMDEYDRYLEKTKSLFI